MVVAYSLQQQAYGGKSSICIVGNMDAGELHQLARLLGAVAQRATRDASDPEMTQGEIAVIRDVLTHPDSSVSAITSRTGFTQSHVSASVIRLRAKGHVETSVDPQDARSTRVRVVQAVSSAVLRRARRPIDGVLRESLSELTDVELRDTVALLERLSQLVRDGQPAARDANRAQR
jgi:DNA-binding MarR family transcriptional regulator